MMHRLRQRLDLVPRLGLMAALGAALAASPSAGAAEPPLPPGAADSALALFDGGAVFPTEYARLWTKLLIASRPAGPVDEAQKVFLTRVVDRKLLAADISRRPFTPSAAEQRQLDQTRDQLVKNLSFHRTIGKLAEPDPAELEIFIRRLNRIAVARLIVFNDWDVARTWRNRLLSGTPMSAFEAALRRDGPGLALADSFRLITTEQVSDTLGQAIWALRPGQVSDVQSFSGRPTLVHLKNFEVRPARVTGELAVKEEFQRRKYDVLRERERLRLAESVARRFEEDALSFLLAAHLRIPPRTDVDTLSGLPVIRPNLPLPEIALADTGRVLARTRNGDTTIGAYLRFWRMVEAYARPEIRERLSLEGAVDRVALDGEILRLALAEGLDRDSTVIDAVARQREGFALDDYFREEIQKFVVLEEKSVRALWEKDPKHYNDPASLEARLLTVDRKSLADSVLERLRGGASFESMAREYSIDQSNADNGFRTGLLYAGSQRNAGLENSMFATEIGGLGGPESTPEGWVIWKLDAKTPGVERTYEMAREMVERDARIMAEEALLEKKLAALRKKARVKLLVERIPEAVKGWEL